MKITRALLSVSNKAGLLELAQFLADRGVEILSTGGTKKALEAAGIPVKYVGDETGFSGNYGWAGQNAASQDSRRHFGAARQSGARGGDAKAWHSSD